MKQDIRSWLGRLSFSFLIVGFVLMWELHKMTGGESGAPWWKVALFLFGAVACFVLGGLGMKARHSQ